MLSLYSWSSCPAFGKHSSARVCQRITRLFSSMQYEVHLFARTPEEFASCRQTIGSVPLKTAEPNGEGRSEAAVQITNDTTTPSATFDSSAYFEQLQTTCLGRTLLTSTDLPSTQSLIQDNRDRLPDGCVCVADQQRAGRGRGKNSWVSPPGCLLFSLQKKLKIAGDRLPLVQYVACIAMVEAVQKLATKRMQGRVPYPPLLRIKWPNDLYSEGGLKVGGILCHSVYKEGSFTSTVGVGLNVSNSEPTTCVNDLLAQRLAANQSTANDIIPVSREEVLGQAMMEMERLLDVLMDQGFGPLEELYYKYWMHSGQQVVLEEKNGSDVLRVPLKVVGISGSGYLAATDADNQTYELHPDGNSFDFFQGLVRKKV